MPQIPNKGGRHNWTPQEQTPNVSGYEKRAASRGLGEPPPELNMTPEERQAKRQTDMIALGNLIRSAKSEKELNQIIWDKNLDGNWYDGKLHFDDWETKKTYLAALADIQKEFSPGKVDAYDFDYIKRRGGRREYNSLFELGSLSPKHVQRATELENWQKKAGGKLAGLHPGGLIYDKDEVYISRAVNSDGTWSTNDPHHVSWHELAHNAAKYAIKQNPDIDNELQSYYNTMGRNMINRSVSFYGGGDYREMAAEAVARYMKDGPDSPKEVLDIVDVLKGGHKWRENYGKYE